MLTRPLLFFLPPAARYSFVIKPINYNLATANVFVGGTNLYQLYRIASAGTSKDKMSDAAPTSAVASA